MLKELENNFVKVFEEKNESAFFSPGRINLIGEHTDYNGGNVFPCSISIGTYGLVSRREDTLVRVYSENFPEKGVIEFDLNDLSYNKQHNWANYPKGMFLYLKEAGYQINHGLNIYFYGNIPNGAGLSSSASIEMLMGVILKETMHLSIEKLELILTGKRVENEYIGVNSGIMDQFAIAMGQKNMAILLDANTLKYEMVPVELGQYVIMIMNTNKRRELADSKYNERRSECEEALKRLQTKLAVTALGELDEETFFKNSELIGDEILIKRAKHAITENQRTLKAKDALVKNDLETFGKLLNASHESLKDDYEVTGFELDTLVYAAQKQASVLGARMTGAGFGGCAIALVAKADIDTFIEKVGNEYQEKVGYSADFYEATVHDGARQLY